MTKKTSKSDPMLQGGLKKGKIKRKQMFNELQTHNEQIINQNPEQDNGNIEDNVGAKMQEEQMDQKLQKVQFGQEKTLEQICQVVNQLMAKNKIGAKNAFDVPIIDLYEMINFKKTEQQNAWKTLSSTFQNDSKIYAYRIDAIHDIAYSILNIMSRRSTETEQKLKPELQKSLQQGIGMNDFDNLKDSFLVNVETDKAFLESDISKINVPFIECELASDPTLQRTKRLFDEPGLKGMLLNSTPINKNLELLLFSNANHEPYSMKLSEVKEVDAKTIEHPLKIFDSIEKVKTQIDKILGFEDSRTLTNKELQQIWGNVKKGNFNDWGQGGQKVWLDVEDPQCRQNFDLMIDENSENHALFENTHRKSIGDFIKMKNQPQKKLMTDQEMQRDAEKWLSDYDRKFLGLKTVNSQKVQPLTTKKMIRAFEDVNFDDIEIYERDIILRKQIPTREINQEIEDKWLTTIRPSNQFRLQKLLTLREQPDVCFPAIQEEIAIEHNQEHFLEKQIDVKRQMTSIKETKEVILNELQSHKHSSFTDVYEGYCQKEEEISPALCFLTLLHLANQKNLSFESINGETDFLIKLPAS